MSVFLVHASVDAQKVFVWEQVLNKAGITTFIAERNLGNETPSSLAQALEKCQIILGFLTPNFMTCGWCKSELAYATNMNRERFAIVLEEVVMSDFAALFFSSSNIWNFDDVGVEEKLVYELKEKLGMPVSGERPAVIHSRKLLWGPQEEKQKEEKGGDNSDDLQKGDVPTGRPIKRSAPDDDADNAGKTGKRAKRGK